MPMTMCYARCCSGSGSASNRSTIWYRRSPARQLGSRAETPFVLLQVMLVKVAYAVTVYRAPQLPGERSKLAVDTLTQQWQAVLSLPPWKAMHDAAEAADYGRLGQAIVAGLPPAREKPPPLPQSASP